MSCFGGQKCRDMRDDFITALLGGKVIAAGQIAVEGAKEMAAGVKESLTTDPKPKRKPRK